MIPLRQPAGTLGLVILSVLLQTATIRAAPVESVRILARFPHDPAAFTQGLVFSPMGLLESTGLYGASTLRQVEATSGEVLRRIELDKELFGEGLAVVGQQAFQLTWRARRGLIYDLQRWRQVGSFRYDTEGWGLTFDGRRLIMSDGSDRLYFLSPDNQSQLGQVRVSDQGRPVRLLNELEYVGGEVYANIWRTPWVARICPRDGRVVGWLDLRPLLRELEGRFGVANGIAYEPETERLLMTGKNWPLLFQVELPEPIGGCPAPES